METLRFAFSGGEHDANLLAPLTEHLSSEIGMRVESRRCKGGATFKGLPAGRRKVILCAFREIRRGSRTILSLTYTNADRGVNPGGSSFYTVYAVPLSALGISGASIGGISIQDDTSNATNIIYLSAIGFFS